MPMRRDRRQLERSFAAMMTAQVPLRRFFSLFDGQRRLLKKPPNPRAWSEEKEAPRAQKKIPTITPDEAKDSATLKSDTIKVISRR